MSYAPRGPRIRRRRRRPLWASLVFVLATAYISAASVFAADCNNNGFDDAEDITAGRSLDCNTNSIPDGGDVLPVNFAPALELVPGRLPNDVVAIDLDGDGHVDLVVSNVGTEERSVAVLSGRGDGTFEGPVTHHVGATPARLDVIDLNADGRLDVVTMNATDETISVLLALAGGGFAPAEDYGVGSFLSDLAVADLDGDERPEVVVVNREDRTLTIRWNDGNGSLPAVSTLQLGDDRPEAVTTADLDRDGDTDLVVAHSEVNNDHDIVFVLFNNGNGTFGLPFEFAVGNNPVDVLAADLNHDEHLDLLVVNVGSDTISVLLNDAIGGFAPTVDYAVDGFPRKTTAGDFDGDGDVDLADYLAFQPCMTGSGVTLAPHCARFDSDGDHDIDLADLLAFQAAFTGAR